MSGEPTIFTGVKKTELSVIIENILGPPGRMISWSKSSYRQANPMNEIYFNACIFDELLVQVWYGDIDLTKEKDKLDEIAKVSEQPFYVTREHYRSDFDKIDRNRLENDDRIKKFNEIKRKTDKTESQKFST